jgi:phosphoribosylglycinamide formyltransferase 2
MGVALVNDSLETPMEEIIERAKAAAKLVKVNA